MNSRSFLCHLCGAKSESTEDLTKKPCYKCHNPLTTRQVTQSNKVNNNKRKSLKRLLQQNQPPQLPRAKPLREAMRGWPEHFIPEIGFTYVKRQKVY